METVSAKPQLRLLLDHLAAIEDTRQSWKVAYPLREVLFLVVCGTIASGDDYDDIVDWGEAHLSLLRRFTARKRREVSLGRARLDRGRQDRARRAEGAR